MRLRSLCAVAFAFGFVALHPGAARAEGHAHRSRGAYVGGLALTSAGSLFLSVGTVYGVGTIAALAGTTAPSTGDGFGALLAGAFGVIIGGGCLLVGTAMLVPGIVLIVKNHPMKDESALRAPVQPVALGAHEQVPSPRFVSIPILSGQF